VAQFTGVAEQIEGKSAQRQARIAKFRIVIMRRAEEVIAVHFSEQQF
jgi:hypothetical protein